VTDVKRWRAKVSSVTGEGTKVGLGSDFLRLARRVDV